MERRNDVALSHNPACSPQTEICEEWSRTVLLCDLAKPKFHAWTRVRAPSGACAAFTY